MTILEKIAGHLRSRGYMPERAGDKEKYHVKYNELPESLAVQFKASLPKYHEFAEDCLITIEVPVCSMQLRR